jgi:hypothetical protein
MGVEYFIALDVHFEFSVRENLRVMIDVPRRCRHCWRRSLGHSVSSAVIGLILCFPSDFDLGSKSEGKTRIERIMTLSVSTQTVALGDQKQNRPVKLEVLLEILRPICCLEFNDDADFYTTSNSS